MGQRAERDPAGDCRMDQRGRAHTRRFTAAPELAGYSMKIITVVNASIYAIAATAVLFAVYELSEAPSTIAPAAQGVPSSVAGSVTGAPGPAPIPSTVAPRP